MQEHVTDDTIPHSSQHIENMNVATEEQLLSAEPSKVKGSTVLYLGLNLSNVNLPNVNLHGVNPQRRESTKA